MRNPILIYYSSSAIAILAIAIAGCNSTTSLDAGADACPPPPAAGGYPASCCDSAGNVESQCEGYSTNPSTPVTTDTANTGSQTASAVESGNSSLNWVNGNSSGSLFVQGSSSLGASSSGGTAGTAVSNLYPGTANSSAATGITGYDTSALRQNSNSGGASSSGGLTAATGAASTAGSGSQGSGQTSTSGLGSDASASLGGGALGNAGAGGATNSGGAGNGTDGTSLGASGAGDASADGNGTADATMRSSGAGTGGSARNPASANGGFQWDDNKGVDQASLKDQGFRPGDIGTMRGTDPADYFARLDVDDSLFKKVTATYQTKAMQWTMSAANESAAAARSLAGLRAAPNAAQLSGQMSAKSRKP